MQRGQDNGYGWECPSEAAGSKRCSAGEEARKRLRERALSTARAVTPRSCGKQSERNQRWCQDSRIVSGCPPWGARSSVGSQDVGGRGLRSSSTGSWAAWGLPAGAGQTREPGMHRPGRRHWVPGTGGARPAAARPWVGPTDLPMHARPQASPADSPLTLPRWRSKGWSKTRPRVSTAASSKAMHAPGWAKVVHAESEVHVQGGACTIRGACPKRCMHNPRCMSKAVHAQSEVHVQGMGPRTAIRLSLRCMPQR